MRKKYTKISTERTYELIMEEHEHNAIVGTTFYETQQFLIGLGYSKGGAIIVLNRLERTYNLNFYRRGQDHRHTDNGDVINSEFGVTRTGNKSLYAKLMAFYRRRLKLGMTKEQAIKETRKYYDPILANERGYESQTEQIAIPLSGRALYQERLKTCEYCDIEF